MSSDNKTKTLTILSKNSNKYISGSYISDCLSISRQAVSKIIGQLKKEGFYIQSNPQKGYLYNYKVVTTFRPTLTQMLIADNSLFKRCIYKNKVTSTQKELKKLVYSTDESGIVYIAEYQSNGRGRRNRLWESKAGNGLTFSMLLRPTIKPTQIQLLNLVIGVALKEVLKTVYSVSSELKWPNDILIRNKKVAGILSEIAGDPDQVHYAISGVGININTDKKDFSPEVSNIATSLFIETGQKVDRAVFLGHFLNILEKYVAQLYTQTGIAKVLEIYRVQCNTIGKMVSVTDDNISHIGRAVAVKSNGELVINTKDGNISFAAADVVHLRSMNE